jgi:hypothetical protein
MSPEVCKQDEILTSTMRKQTSFSDDTLEASVVAGSCAKIRAAKAAQFYLNGPY